MAEYDNTNRGVLFRNEKMQEGSNQPDYTGSLNAGGIEHFFDAWLKTSKEGKKFFSVSIKPKEQRQAAPVVHAPTTRNGAAFDDEIPFAPFHAD